MADYKELLRRAIAALPENNGASRRAVYEKARSALVGQLRAINPPLAARDITSHRLQLEDCIRQVEQEASEAIISRIDTHDAKPKPAAAEPKPEAAAPKEVPADKALPNGAAKPGSIEDIIAAADRAAGEPKRAPESVKESARTKPDPVRAEKPAPPKPFVVAKSEPKEAAKEPARAAAEETPPKGKGGRPLPSIVARAEAAKAKGTTAFGVPTDKPYNNDRRGPVLEPRREVAARVEPATTMRGQTATARQTVVEPIAFPEPPAAVAPALSTVREVEVEPIVAADPQGAIDRAIATLDRAARGEEGEEADANGAVVDLTHDAQATDGKAKKPGKGLKGTPPDHAPRKKRGASPFGTDTGFQRPQSEPDRGGISALTIFLFVFVILLAGVGGAGFWAWREGYIDLDSMFAGSAPQLDAAAPQAELTPVPVVDNTAATGPGNTSSAPPAPAAPTAAEVAAVPPTAEARLPSTSSETTQTSAVQPLALVPPIESATPTTEERLPVAGAETAPATDTAARAVDPAALAGSQSLLLEASDEGGAGAVPFSGTVDWSKGIDETGAPTIVGRANIPARNMSVDILIRRNADASFTLASHLMEINFVVTEQFIGGQIAAVPGILLKNQELVQGTPLSGASARVVGNTFLFAFSADDAPSNNRLMTGQKWMDIALIYATGKRAIITLEKDPAAEALFNEVYAAWGATASAQ